MQALSERPTGFVQCFVQNGQICVG